VYSCERHPKFQRNISPPSSGSKSKESKEPVLWQATRRRIELLVSTAVITSNSGILFWLISVAYEDY
jgi:hypothetical protein